MTAGRYAAGTDVSSTRSREEIERTLTRYGASEFAYGWDAHRAVLGFAAHGRRVRFTLPLPDRKARAITHTPSRGALRSPAAQAEAYEQAVRQRWRALALVVKAKLEAVEAGIAEFDQEFLAHIIVGEQTVGEVLVPQLDAAIAGSRPLALLPGPTS